MSASARPRGDEGDAGGEQGIAVRVGDQVRLVRLAPAVGKLAYFAEMVGEVGTVEEVRLLVRFGKRTFVVLSSEIEEVSE